MSAKSEEVINHDAQSEPVLSAKDVAVRDLAHALNEASLARMRFEKRTSPIGLQGENFDDRAARAEHIVQKFNERVVTKARKDALRAGWTAEQLESSALNGVGLGSGNARA